ncbi:MAG: hypothetical protein Q4C70_08715 [Planctomycetia bacterium]|nr:hypothetical protein [Planctomycetia bacterium]
MTPSVEDIRKDKDISYIIVFDVKEKEIAKMPLLKETVTLLKEEPNVTIYAFNSNPYNCNREISDLTGTPSLEISEIVREIEAKSKPEAQVTTPEPQAMVTEAQAMAQPESSSNPQPTSESTQKSAQESTSQMTQKSTLESGPQPTQETQSGSVQQSIPTPKPEPRKVPVITEALFSEFRKETQASFEDVKEIMSECRKILRKEEKSEVRDLRNQLKKNENCTKQLLNGITTFLDSLASEIHNPDVDAQYREKAQRYAKMLVGCLNQQEMIFEIVDPEVGSSWDSRDTAVKAIHAQDQEVKTVEERKVLRCLDWGYKYCDGALLKKATVEVPKVNYSSLVSTETPENTTEETLENVSDSPSSTNEM